MAFVAKKLERGIRSAESIVSAIGGVMLLVMMFLGAGDVIGRYIFNSPIGGAIDISQLMMGGMVFFGWAWVFAQKAHVSVDLVFTHYPARAQAIIELIMLILIFVLFGIIAWQAGAIAVVDWQANRLVQIIRIPAAPFKMFIPFGAFLLCLESIIQIAHLIPKVRTGKEG